MDQVRQWQRKPSKPAAAALVTARFTPGEPAGALLEVAWTADDSAEAGEVTFSTGPVLIVQYMAAGAVKWVAVRPGFNLAYRADYGGMLMEVSDATLDRWYQEMP